MKQSLVKFLIVTTTVLFLFRTACAVSVRRLSNKEHEETFHRFVKNGARQAVQFSFARHFQSHMVLQKEPAKANIYGFSPSIGQTVNAQLVTLTKTYTYSATVQTGSQAGIGVWTILLDAQNADTAANISVTSQGTTLSLTDIIFGDVWICSGQSNMQFSVSQMEDADAEKADVDYPKIRLFTVADKESTTPLDDILEIWQPWTSPNSNAVSSFSALCWVYGKNIHKAMGFSIGLIHSSWGGTPAEAWSSPEALAKCGNTKSTPVKHDYYMRNIDQYPGVHKERLFNPTDKSVLWNAMIYPLLKTSIRGVIWYQGESDAWGIMMDHYNCTFPTMISDWRQNFNKASNQQTDASFPFGFVQLAPYEDQPTHTVGFTDIRWHQTADFGYAPNSALPNTFMAVAIDLPDFNSPWGSIHPRYKKDIGDRLSLGGLTIAYGRSEVFQGPYPSKGEVTSNGFKITYGSDSTLEIRSSSGFEILCSGTWIAASITSNDQVSVTLQNVCQTGQSVSGVRYAWRESPCAFKLCAVYEKVNGLPAAPFILTVNTDDNGKHVFDFDHPIAA